MSRTYNKGKKKATKGKRTMKKVSKKGAYKKSVKKQTVRRRAPIVETKQRVHSDIAHINGYYAGAQNYTNPLNWKPLTTEDAFTLLPLASWCRISHGFQEYQCVGNSIFSKFLNLKLEVKFPDGDRVDYPSVKTPGTWVTPINQMIEKPTKVYLVCGWITQPMNFPVDDNPSPSLPKQSEATVSSLSTYITQQLKPFFDDDIDKLQFRPKQTTNIKIEKYVQIKPNLGSAIATQASPYHITAPPGELGPAVAYRAQGSIPNVRRSHSWKTMRKIPLTEGVAAGYAVDKQNLYPNNSWVPFAVIYNPMFQDQENETVFTEDGEVDKIQKMFYRYNDAHYFTDS